MEDKVMETKKKLRVDINRLFTAIGLMEHELAQHRDKIEALELKEQERADTITAKEAAQMLGYHTAWISSATLTKKGIAHKKDDNGCLVVSRKSVEEYLNNRNITDED